MIRPHDFMANGEKVVVTAFRFSGSKITVDDDCSHVIRRQLLLGRKALTNLDSLLKSRDITLLTKVCIVEVMVFPVVTYGCESWTVKKAECQKIDALELWCWKILLKVLGSKEIKPVNLKGDQLWIFTERTDIEAEAEAAGFWSSDAHRQLIGKVPDAGKDWGQKKKRASDEMTGHHHQWNEHEIGQSLGRSRKPGVLQSMGSQRVRHNWAIQQQQNGIVLSSN